MGYNTNQRIDITDNMMTAVMKLSDGNPGAVSAIMAMVKAVAADPDSGLGELAPLIGLDSEGVYGPAVWVLFKDVCEHDPVRCLALFRVGQLGLKELNLSDVLGCAPNYETDREKIEELKTFARDEAVDLVRTELPNFAPGWSAAA